MVAMGPNHNCTITVPRAYIVRKVTRLIYYNVWIILVPGAGVEPARGCPRGILSPLRLPVPPPGHHDVGACDLVEAGVGIEPAYTALQAAA